MKISIYPKASFLPKTKQDKITQGILASNPNIPEVVEVSTDEDLISYITSYAWSPSVFSGTRLNNNFVSADFMTLDIDEGMTIPDAEKRIQSLGLACLCLPSPSHTEEFHRFRLVFPLAKTIFDGGTFDSTWEWLHDKFPELDAQCSDLCRYYCCSKMDDGFWQEGDFLVPIKTEVDESIDYKVNENQVLVPEGMDEIVELLYGKKRDTIPESISFFLENAHSGLSGLWINSLNAFVFSLALSGVDGNIIEEVVEKLAPESLDKKDLYQIKRAIRDGNKHRDLSS